MIRNTECKAVIVTPPAAIIDNASATTNSIDTKGFKYCVIVVTLGATDIALTALKVQESDTDGSYADITGAVFGTSNNTGGTASTLPSATDDNKVYMFEINLIGRKRYLDVVLTFGDGTAGGFVSAIALLSRGEDAVSTATKRGAAQIVRV